MSNAFLTKNFRYIQLCSRAIEFYEGKDERRLSYYKKKMQALLLKNKVINALKRPNHKKPKFINSKISHPQIIIEKSVTPLGNHEVNKPSTSITKPTILNLFAGKKQPIRIFKENTTPKKANITDKNISIADSQYSSNKKKSKENIRPAVQNITKPENSSGCQSEKKYRKVSLGKKTPPLLLDKSREEFSVETREQIIKSLNHAKIDSSKKVKKILNVHNSQSNLKDSIVRASLDMQLVEIKEKLLARSMARSNSRMSLKENSVNSSNSEIRNMVDSQLYKTKSSGNLFNDFKNVFFSRKSITRLASMGNAEITEEKEFEDV